MHTISSGVTYLDLDGDGVPDAVLTVETWPDATDHLDHLDGLDHLDHRTVVETLERDIGIDGRPGDVRVLARG